VACSQTCYTFGSGRSTSQNQIRTRDKNDDPNTAAPMNNALRRPPVGLNGQRLEHLSHSIPISFDQLDIVEAADDPASVARTTRPYGQAEIGRPTSTRRSSSTRTVVLPPASEALLTSTPFGRAITCGFSQFAASRMLSNLE
jgi:hypothetical protein